MERYDEWEDRNDRHEDWAWLRLIGCALLVFIGGLVYLHFRGG